MDSPAWDSSAAMQISSALINLLIVGRSITLLLTLAPTPTLTTSYTSTSSLVNSRDG